MVQVVSLIRNSSVIHMIKNFFIACVFSPCMCSYADEQLSLTSPKNGNLSSSNSFITWSEDYSSLSSWRLSFDLTRTLDVDNATIFYTGYFDGGAYKSSLSLSLNNDGSVYLKSGKTVLTTSESSWITLNNPVAVELEFVTVLDEDCQVVGGMFSATIGDNELVCDFADNSLEFLCLYDDPGNYPQPLISSANGYVQFSNIQLYKLDDRLLVPEPTTATLSLFALVALVSRRRRK